MHNKYTQEEKSCMIESIDRLKHLHTHTFIYCYFSKQYKYWYIPALHDNPTSFVDEWTIQLLLPRSLSGQVLLFPMAERN